ncbi:MAG: hypothetical protein HQM08_04710 [Candidatus Riflebacteria bacterium]|nr:hypothetical protein [Candidatus Riflebacteria bacterium]
MMQFSRKCKGLKSLVLLTTIMIFCTRWLGAIYSYSLDYETSRTKAMGGASIGLSNDYQALFSNPAGLGWINDKSYGIIQAEGEVNSDWQKVSNKLNELSSKDTPWDRSKNDQILNEISGKIGRVGFSNLAYYLGAANFGVGFLCQGLTDFEVVNPVTPKIRAFESLDSVLTGSIARPFRKNENLFSADAVGWWGGTMKFLSRRTADEQYFARDFAGLSKSDMRNNEKGGATLDFDAGTMWYLKSPWRSNLGLLVKNILESEIDPVVGKLRREWGLGVSINPLEGPPGRNKKLTLAADYWYDNPDSSVFSRFRFGGEAQVNRWLVLRAGIRGGYLSGGFGADFKTVKLDFSTYSEEIGIRPGDKEDRRYTLGLGVEF